MASSEFFCPGTNLLTTLAWGVGGDRGSLSPQPPPSAFPSGANLSFLFAAPLILLVFSTFLVGGNVQTLVCRSWESGKLYEVGGGRSEQRKRVEGSGGQRRQEGEEGAVMKMAQERQKTTNQ